MDETFAVPEVQYAERIVGFADVLGWRAHIAETLTNPMRLLFLHTIVESWSNLSRGNYSANFSDLKASSFSWEEFHWIIAVGKHHNKRCRCQQWSNSVIADEVLRYPPPVPTGESSPKATVGVRIETSYAP